MNPSRPSLFVGAVTLSAALATAQVPQWTAHSNNAPGPRFGAGLCALGSGSLLLFGGDNGVSRLGDTWRYDIATNTWTQLVLPQSPSPRRWHAMTLHEATGHVVLHGGQTTAGDVGDTWIFNSGVWTQANGAGPSARSTHAIAYDPVRQRSVLFGGSSVPDTWEWNNTAWVQRSLTATPSARSFVGMAFDDRRGVMVLAGGSLPNGNYTNQVWELGASAWVQSSVSLPFLRAGAEFAYDKSRGRMVMFGGLQQGATGITAQGDLHEWDGTSPAWVVRSAATLIPPRYGSDLVYRSGSGIWLFGGSGFGPIHGDLRRYFIQNGASYTQSGPGCGAPALAARPESLPWLGDSFVREAQFSTLKLVLHEIGFTSQDLDLTFLGMPGCRLGGSADVITSLLASGTTQFVLNIPIATSLNGIEFFEQLAVFTPGINPFGVEMSPTMRMRLSSK